jgi:hypothetical protein
MVLEMNQDQTVICFLVWSAAWPAERKSALVSRKTTIIRLFIENLSVLPLLLGRKALLVELPPGVDRES